ncbi:MAG TPA: hypothetical protein VIJ15_13040, partial [Dermatophilaceae bacterium]
MTPHELISRAMAALRARRDDLARREPTTKATAALRLRRDDLARGDLITRASVRLGLRRDDMVRVARVLMVSLVGLVCVVMVSSAPGWGVTHALLGIHQAPKATATSVPLNMDQATKILSRSLTAANLGETKTGAASGKALRAAYTGQGLRGAGGRVRLA